MYSLGWITSYSKKLRPVPAVGFPCHADQDIQVLMKVFYQVAYLLQKQKYSSLYCNVPSSSPVSGLAAKTFCIQTRSASHSMPGRFVNITSYRCKILAMECMRQFQLHLTTRSQSKYDHRKVKVWHAPINTLKEISPWHSCVKDDE